MAAPRCGLVVCSIAVDAVRHRPLAAAEGFAVGVGGGLLRPFIARPAKVGARPADVDLLPLFVAHLAHDQAPVARVDGEAEGVAHSQRKDFGAVAAGVAVEEGVARQPFAGSGSMRRILPLRLLMSSARAVALAVDDAVAHRDVERAFRPKAGACRWCAPYPRWRCSRARAGRPHRGTRTVRRRPDPGCRRARRCCSSRPARRRCQALAALRLPASAVSRTTRETRAPAGLRSLISGGS
jgi:hypothetical protein